MTNGPDDEPPAALSPEERLAEMRRVLREFQKAERLRKLASGRGKPRTRREMEIWSEGVRRRLDRAAGERPDGDG